MRSLTGNPRARMPRRGSRPSARPDASCEPATFAWIEPLADVDPVVVEREIVVESQVDRPVYVEKPVYVDRTVEIEKIVEKPVYVDRTVEIEKIVEKVVEKPIEIEKIVEKVIEKPIIVEKEVFVKVAATPVARATEAAKGKTRAPKAIIVGRGPTLVSKLGRVMPKPLPVLAGATALLAVLAGLALMSPSGDDASAERTRAQKTDAATPSDVTPSLTLAANGSKPLGKSRDPFAAEGYKAPAPKPTAAKDDAAAKADAATRAAAPAAVATPLFTASLTAYSSFTPWKNLRKRAGGWIDFAEQPTVKVLSVGKSSVLLFVVTDVEVIKEKSSHISYNKPVRQVKVAKGGVVRFADYRDIQGDDVTYTVRYDGSEKIKVKSAAK